VCGLAGAAAFVGLILVPRGSRRLTPRPWQRVARGGALLLRVADVVSGVLGAYGVYELWISYG